MVLISSKILHTRMLMISKRWGYHFKAYCVDDFKMMRIPFQITSSKNVDDLKVMGGTISDDFKVMGGYHFR